MSWDRARFDKLLRDGFISKWRERKRGEFDVYEVSFKGKKMIASIYRKLLGLEPIPESPRRNIVFRPNATFAQKTLAIAIKRINKEARECKQRPSPEE
jgi:DNA-binding PadR family transcriptional regulator